MKMSITKSHRFSESFIGSSIIDIGLVLLGALLFSLSFPSFISKWGWFPLAYVALVPVFIVAQRSGWISTIIMGFLYGFTAYALFNFWLAKFHPLADIIVPFIYALYFVIVFPLLKLAGRFFGRFGYIAQIIIWIAFEYVRTLGFLGYSFGILGYSQYLFLPLIRASAIAGVWGISLIVVFPSAFIANGLVRGITSFSSHIRRSRIELISYLLLFLGAITYGFAQKTDFSEENQWRVALIQHNIDPWKGGISAYKRSYEILSRLSLKAEEENPDIIVWSETAFVPGIDWHTKYRTSAESYRLVKELTDFLKRTDTPYLVGNDDGQLAVPGSPPVNSDGSLNRIDYNAVLLYAGGEIVDTYRKIHLVPFTESFPYQKTFPRIYQWLIDWDTHLWEKGSEWTVFESDGVYFSTPICFEDTFGYLSRAFVNEGAQVIVNVTNDSWSKSVAAEMQHMMMSVFRAVENRRTVVRATNGGMTATIEPDGKITAILDPFTEGYLVNDVPVYEGPLTLYTRWGDWFGKGALILAIGSLLLGLLLHVTKPKPSFARLKLPST